MGTVEGVTRGRLRILVVDEDSSVRVLMRDLLEDAGYWVAEAMNGQDALERETTLDPDLVLVDLMSPGRNGAAVVGELLSHGRTVVIVSCFIEVREALSLNATAFLSKPFKFADLLAVCRTALEDKSVSRVGVASGALLEPSATSEMMKQDRGSALLPGETRKERS